MGTGGGRAPSSSNLEGPADEPAISRSLARRRMLKKPSVDVVLPFDVLPTAGVRSFHAAIMLRTELREAEEGATPERRVNWVVGDAARGGESMLDIVDALVGEPGREYVLETVDLA